MVLAYAATYNLLVEGDDVSNAHFYGRIERDVYIEQPTDSNENLEASGFVRKLQRFMSEIQQAGRNRGAPHSWKDRQSGTLCNLFPMKGCSSTTKVAPSSSFALLLAIWSLYRTAETHWIALSTDVPKSLMCKYLKLYQCSLARASMSQMKTYLFLKPDISKSSFASMNFCSAMNTHIHPFAIWYTTEKSPRMCIAQDWTLLLPNAGWRNTLHGKLHAFQYELCYLWFGKKKAYKALPNDTLQLYPKFSGTILDPTIELLNSLMAHSSTSRLTQIWIGVVVKKVAVQLLEHSSRLTMHQSYGIVFGNLLWHWLHLRRSTLH